MKKQETRRFSAESIAWWCLVAIPVVIPTFISKVWLVSGNPFTFNPFGVPKLFALGLLTSASLVAWAVALVMGQLQLREVKSRWWALALLVLACASTVFAVERTMSFFGGHGQYVGLLTLLLCAAVALLVTQLLTSRARMVQLSRATVIGGSVVSAVSVLQAMGADPLGMPIEAGWMLTRGMATIGNPDLTGTYLVVPLIIAIALSFAEETASWRVASAVQSGLLAVALTLTLTRGAWVGAIVGIVVFAIAFRRSSASLSVRAKQAGLGAIGAVAVTALLVAPQFLSRFTELAAGKSAGSGRLVYWAEALKIIAKYPLLGTGPDGYVYGWWGTHSLDSVALAGANGAVGDPHNALLYLAATLGVPALVAACGLIYVVMRSGFSAAFAVDAKVERLVFSGWWAATAAFCVALFFSVSTIVALMMLALCLAVLAAAGARPTEVARGWVYSVAAICTVLAVGAVVVVTMYVASDRSLAKELDGNREVNAREAVARAPWNYQARYHLAYELYSQAALSRPADGPQVKPLFERADQAVRELIAFNEHEDDSYVLLLKLHTEAGSTIGPQAYQSAVEVADQALVLHPNGVELQVRKALALYLLERYQEMLGTLQPIWDADPAYSLPGTLYAEALIANGRAPEAADVLTQLEARFPADAEVARVRELLDAK